MSEREREREREKCKKGDKNSLRGNSKINFFTKEIIGGFLAL